MRHFKRSCANLRIDSEPDVIRHHVKPFVFNPQFVHSRFKHCRIDPVNELTAIVRLDSQGVVFGFIGSLEVRNGGSAGSESLSIEKEGFTRLHPFCRNSDLRRLLRRDNSHDQQYDGDETNQTADCGVHSATTIASAANVSSYGVIASTTATKSGLVSRRISSMAFRFAAVRCWNSWDWSFPVRISFRRRYTYPFTLFDRPSKPVE